jgi:hypothetical protein
MIGDLRFKIGESIRGARRGLKPAGLVLAATLFLQSPTSRAQAAFEGRINAVMIRGNQNDVLLYTVGTNFMRLEMTATNWPNPVDILDRDSGELTLLFPNNRSFVRLKPTAENSSAAPPGFPQMHGGLPPGVGLQPHAPGAIAMPNLPPPPGIGPTNLPGMPAPPPMRAMPNMPPGVGPQSTPGTPSMPAMPGASGGMPAIPMMPPPMMEQLELQDTGQKTNLLGFACEQYEIKQRGGTMEIWATDQLFPFQPYVQNQPHRFGPRMIEEQWGDLLKAKKLFPLLASLKFDNGAERFRFEVQSITRPKLTTEDAKLFQPPSGYFEIQPLPF